jgi:folate-binding protein YgfZ
VFTLDTDSGLGDVVLARLKKFILRSKVVMRRSEWTVRSIFGTGAKGACGGVVGAASRWWGGVDDVDVIGDAATLPVVGTAISQADCDLRRVDAGWPAVGRDIEVGDFPATTGLLRVAVSFSKGCYPGQELVERMDSRGSSAPVQLVVAPVGEVGDVGSSVIVDGKEIGVVTSCGLARALVRVKRGAEVSEFWVRPDRFAESLL